MTDRRVLGFYKFMPVSDPGALQHHLRAEGERLNIKGTILLAEEGVNGTLVGTQLDLRRYQKVLTDHFAELPFKWSRLNENNHGFYRFKVKVKPEIVSFGVEDLDIRLTGEHVNVEQWHALLDDPDVVVVDTRNAYEVDIGTFPVALNPQTTNFREFPQWVKEHLDPDENKRVAMFCTGGIRCEKASAYMKQAGFESVYQLDGGVLRYLEAVAPDTNRWSGECFVFDQRVSVNADLAQGQYQQCYACRHPLSASDLESKVYELGVNCPHCAIASEGDEQAHAARKTSLRERQKQVELAQSRGAQHIGAPQE